MQEKLKRIIMAMDTWNERNNWKAYDPFDGLSSSFTKVLTFDNAYLRIVLQQFNRRFPFNIRPLIGIQPAMSSKAMGFFAQGYLRLYETLKDDRFLEKANFCLNWLTNNFSRGYSGYCWGNHFDYQSRGGRIKKGIPSVVWTGLIGHAFMDAYDSVRDEKYLKIAESICDFIIKDLPQTNYGDTVHIAYTPDSKYGQNQIHNSSIIGASLLARVYRENNKKELISLSRKAVSYTVERQLSNGGWYYGENSKFHWIDSFHTGYVLEALDYYVRLSEDSSFQDSLERGYKYYVETFFKQNGVPYYYNTKMRPLDIQCASQGIQTLINLRRLDDKSIPTALAVAKWTINNMYNKSGYFHYRKYPLITNKTPTLHWGQATMFAALCILLKNQLNNNSNRD